MRKPPKPPKPQALPPPPTPAVAARAAQFPSSGKGQRPNKIQPSVSLVSGVQTRLGRPTLLGGA